MLAKRTLTAAVGLVLIAMSISAPERAKAFVASELWVAQSGTANAPGTSCNNPGYVGLTDVAIQAAVTDAAVNAVIHICNGTYNFSNSVSLSLNLTIQGENRSGVVLDADSLTRFFAIAQNKQINLSSMTMREGSATQGGAIFADYGSVVSIADIKIMNCGSLGYGRYGGAIYSFGNVNIDQSQFNNNYAEDGGAFNINGLLTLSNSQFSSNGALRYGGAANVGSAVVTSSQFTTNSSGYGGAINGASVTVGTSTFTSNTASSYGGAIQADTATVVASTFTGNFAPFGGAVRAAEVTATTSTFTSNHATGNGGGISANTSAAVTGSTFASNNAPYGGAISALAVTATTSNFTGNTATYGGAMYTSGATVTDSTFTGNQANVGGAIRTEQGAAITNSAFTSNSVLETGGAISAGGVVNAIGGTFSRNSAPQRGAVAYAEGGGTVCGDTQGAPGTWESCALPPTNRDGSLWTTALMIMAVLCAAASIGLLARGAKGA
jgi:predicted outer membrane repeat protein